VARSGLQPVIAAFLFLSRDHSTVRRFASFAGEKHCYLAIFEIYYSSEAALKEKKHLETRERL
jgi:hypothetical protein